MVVLILIGGPSGAGKTTVAEKLAKKIDATVIEMDRFYMDIEEARKLFPDTEYPNWDHPSTFHWDDFNESLDALSKGGDITLPFYSKISNKREEYETLNIGKYVIVEGLWALSDKVTADAYRIYVTIDHNGEETRYARRLERDLKNTDRKDSDIKQWWDKYTHPMEKEHVLPTQANADLVVNNTDLDTTIRQINSFCFG